MGFDGAATFSGKKSGVQARLKKPTRSFRPLSLPFAAIGLHTSCQHHNKNKACLYNIDISMEVLPPLPKKGTIFERD